VTAELSFVELAVGDWPAAVAWYRDVLGLPVLLLDEAGRFALLGGDAGKVALKAGTPQPGSVRLAFRVDDLGAELTRLAACGVTPDGPPKASAEGYTRALLHDLDGYQLSLFALSSRRP
jgi:catechol 2,3-dioxygenase-like lactoylglutathione lyase family enzyme